MELRVLRYFLTVVREENISRAAEILHITQPTLSWQLAQLEEELGASLPAAGESPSPSRGCCCAAERRSWWSWRTRPSRSSSPRARDRKSVV